jgi:hypothetical protein
MSIFKQDPKMLIEPVGIDDKEYHTEGPHPRDQSKQFLAVILACTGLFGFRALIRGKGSKLPRPQNAVDTTYSMLILSYR